MDPIALDFTAVSDPTVVDSTVLDPTMSNPATTIHCGFNRDLIVCIPQLQTQRL